MASEAAVGGAQCCDGCTAKECKASRVVSRGISLPLQIFKTTSAGWGMRCASFIPIGAFVCEYSGAIMTDTEAVIFLPKE